MEPAASWQSVFLREAWRNARKPTTFALRTGLSAVALGALGLMMSMARVRVDDPAALARIGREGFDVLSLGLLLSVGSLSALMAAAAIQEERDEGTLDLLVLSRLEALDILVGKVSSRVGGLLVAVLGVAPVFALLLSFGGVSPLRVVVVVGNTLVAALLMASMGAYFGLLTRNGPLPALGLSLVWCVPAFLFVPIPGLVAADRTPLDSGALMFMVNPVAAVFADSWHGLLPMAVMLPSVVLVGVMAEPVFRILMSTDPDDGETFGVLSPEIWRLERVTLQVYKALAVLLFALVVWVFWVQMRLWPTYATAGWVVALAWTTAAQVVWMGVWLVMGTRIVHLVQGELLDQKRASVVRLEPRQVWVWSPVLMWRGWQSRSSKGLVWLAALLGAAWMLGGLAVAGRLDATDAGVLGGMLIGQSWLFAGLLVVQDVTRERQARMGELLVLTRISRWGLALGGVGAALLRVMPLWVVASVVLLWSAPDGASALRVGDADLCTAVGPWWARAPLWGVYGAMSSAGLGLATAWVSWALRSERLAWPWALGMWVSLWAVPWFTLHFAGWELWSWLSPWTAYGMRTVGVLFDLECPGMPLRLIFATAMWTVVALLLAVGLALWLPRTRRTR